MRLRSSRSSTIRAEPRPPPSRSARRAGGRPRGPSTADQRLGQQRQRADRRLELVAHVGDEVAAHALDPPRTRRRRATSPTAPSGARRPSSGRAVSPEHLGRRAEELQLARALLARARSVEQLVAAPRRPGRRRDARRGSARPRRCGAPRRRRRRRRRSRRRRASSASASRRRSRSSATAAASRIARRSAARATAVRRSLAAVARLSRTDR